MTVVLFTDVADKSNSIFFKILIGSVHCLYWYTTILNIGNNGFLKDKKCCSIFSIFLTT